MDCGGRKTPPDPISGALPGTENPRSAMEPPGPRFQKPGMCTSFFWGFSGKVLDFLKESENPTTKSDPFRGAKSPPRQPPPAVSVNTKNRTFCGSRLVFISVTDARKINSYVCAY